MVDVTKHFDIVDVHVAKVLGRYPEDQKEEARAIGLLALCEAAAKFDPERGTKFTSYAWSVIRHELVAYRTRLAFERVGIRLNNKVLWYLCALDARARELGHFPEFPDELPEMPSRFTETMYRKLREYHETAIEQNAVSLVDDLVTDRRVGVS